MGLELEMGGQIWKIVVVSFKTCYRIICSHPFVVGLFCFLFFLYRSCPLLFSLLVSASPVLICTAVLLGTLLSFGKPNIPEIEKEDSFHNDIASLKTGVLESSTIFGERDESFAVERGCIIEKAIDEASSVQDRKISKVDYEDGLENDTQMIIDNSREFRLEKEEIQESTEKTHGADSENAMEIHENLVVKDLSNDGDKAIEPEYSLLWEGNDVSGVEDGKELSKSVSANKGHHHTFLANGGGGDDEEGASSYSGSDRSESDSPDASMADIIPMLDELHPLLDTEVPQPAHIPGDGSDAASEQSHRSEDDHVVSEENAENQRDDVGEDCVDDDEEEEEIQGDKEDESKSAIKWTDDDQKNLMDLGTSELERNQRLEHLIARRRARRLIAEKNLIDLDTIDLSFNVPPISTTRRNPFDIPFDSYESMGLPPIPGSAPSILLPRRNPFDLPYDSTEEKPDLKGDNFEQEFMPLNQKDAIFRRHESFSLGPSGLGGPRQERHDIKWRPYFVPEKLDMEGTSYSPFQRQSSGLSESKLSSVPDSESISSIADQDEKRHDEQHSDQEAAESSLANIADHIELGSESSRGDDSVDTEQVERNLHHDVVEITLGNPESHQEMESALFNAEQSDTHQEVTVGEMHPKTELPEGDFCGNSGLSASPEEETISAMETGGLTTSDQRSFHPQVSVPPKIPSLEETSAKFGSRVLEEFQHKDPVYDSSPPAEGKLHSFPSISSKTQEEIAKVCIPPPSLETASASSGDDSKVHCESTQEGSPLYHDTSAVSPQLHVVNENVLGSREISELVNNDGSRSGYGIFGSNSDNQDGFMAPESTVEYISANSSSSSSEIGSIDKADALKEQNSGKVEETSSGEDPDLLSLEAEAVELHATDRTPQLEPAEIYLPNGQVVEDVIPKEMVSYPNQGDVDASNVDVDNPAIGVMHVAESFLASGRENVTSNDLALPEAQENIPLAVLDRVPTSQQKFSSELELEQGHSMSAEEIVLRGRNIAPSSAVDADTVTSDLQGSEAKQVSSVSGFGHLPPAEQSIPEFEEQQPGSDSSLVEPASDSHMSQEPDTIIADLRKEISVDKSVVVPYVEDQNSTSPSAADESPLSPAESPDNKFLPSGGQLRGDILGRQLYDDYEQVSEQLDYLAEAYGSFYSERKINEDATEIKDIDDVLLSELDTVGDFNVAEATGELFHPKFSPEETDAKSTAADFLHKNLDMTETSLELPVLEARSMEDINLAFRQLHEGVDVDEVILPSMVKNMALEEGKEVAGGRSEMQTVEARSLEDIHAVLKDVLKKDASPTEISKEDDETSKKDAVIEEVSEKNELLEVSQKVATPEDSETETALKEDLETEAALAAVPLVEMQTIEARSLEDIHAVLQDVPKKDAAPMEISKEDDVHNEISEKDAVIKEVSEKNELLEISQKATVLEDSEKETALQEDLEKAATPAPVSSDSFAVVDKIIDKGHPTAAVSGDDKVLAFRETALQALSELDESKS